MNDRKEQPMKKQIKKAGPGGERNSVFNPNLAVRSAIPIVNLHREGGAL